MSTYEARYQYVKPGSSSKGLTSLQVKADSEEIAYKLAENQAKSKHSGCEIYILELRKR